MVVSKYCHLLQWPEGLPSTYLILDAETTGTRPDSDLVVQLGMCIVDRGHTDGAGARILNWTRHPEFATDGGALRDRLNELQQQLESGGKRWHVTYDRMLQEGDEPLSTMRSFRDRILYEFGRGNTRIIGNGLLQIHLPMLRGLFQEYLDEEFPVTPMQVFDTGIVCKAIQMGLYPWPGDTCEQWTNRVHEARARGVRWSLGGYAIENFHLDTKYGVDPRHLYDAGYDCNTMHCLIEEWRQLRNATTRLP